jgi:hypothetical protein
VAVSPEGEKRLVGVECKARVTAGMHQREREHAEFLSHFQQNGSANVSTARGTELYTVIDAASAGDFHSYIDSSHEAVQLLGIGFVFVSYSDIRVFPRISEYSYSFFFTRT